MAIEERKITALIAILTTSICNIFSQITTDNSEIREIIYRIAEETEKEDETDIETISDETEEIVGNKINLNSVTLDELRALPFLSDRAANEIIKYRLTHQKFYTKYELKTINGINKKELDILKEIVFVGEEDSNEGQKDACKNIRIKNTNFYGRTIEKKAGYSDTITSPYLGKQNRFYSKINLKGKDRIEANLTLEKDEGEKIWSEAGKPFDFTSGYGMVKKVGPADKIVIGDYKVSFGEGLVIGNSMSIGKSIAIQKNSIGGKGIKGHSSVSENGFLRGIAATFRIEIQKKDIDKNKKIKTPKTKNEILITPFASARKIDAVITDNGEIKTLKTDGLHRTETETKNAKTTWLGIFGGNITFSSHKNYEIGITTVHYKYNRILNPPEYLYNKFKLRNTDRNTQFGIHYKFNLWNTVTISGEIATSGFNSLATINSLRYYPGTDIAIGLIHRHYSPRYQSVMAKAFSENTRPENENGLYLGMEYSKWKKTNIKLYMDLYRFPWPKYQVRQPSEGADFMFVSDIFIGKKQILTTRYKFKHSQKNDKYEPALSNYITQSVRATYKANKIGIAELKTTLDANFYKENDNKTTYGFMAAQELTLSTKRDLFSCTMKYAYFNCTNYSNRIYSYEKDVFGYFNIPQLYGTGHRFSASIKIQPTENISIYAKYGITKYTDGRESTGTVKNEIIKGNHISQVRVSSIIKF